MSNEFGELIACFDMAFSEGLQEALANTTDEHLKDLIERRLLVGYYNAIGPSPTAQPAPAATFQQRVQPWLLECFGAEIAADRVERNHRFLEEALELVQSLGCTASEAHQLVDYVFGRPVGDPPQEAGGVMVTLAALCLVNDLDMHYAGEVELARISAPEMVAKIRAKQAAKPKHSPLPEAAPAAGAVPVAYVQRFVGGAPSLSWRHKDIADLPDGTALIVAPTPAAQGDAEDAAMEAHRKNGLAWAVHRWEDEVKHRPLVNVHRRTLDGTWRQVVRYFEGDPDALLGPSHDAALAQKEGKV